MESDARRCGKTDEAYNAALHPAAGRPAANDPKIAEKWGLTEAVCLGK